MSTPSGQLPPQLPPVPAGVAVAPAAQTNNLAVASLVTGIASFFAHIIPFVGGFTLAVVAIITGHMALGQIKNTGEQGRPLAIAGLVIGYVHLALIALVFIFFFGFIVAVLGAIVATGGSGG